MTTHLLLWIIGLPFMFLALAYSVILTCVLAAKRRMSALICNGTPELLAKSTVTKL
jgi:hypothetical protein